MKRSLKLLLIVPALVLAYLAIAALWARASFDAALASVPLPQSAPMSERQTAILLRVEDPAFFEHHGLSIGSGQGLATISSVLDARLSKREQLARYTTSV